MSRSFLLGFVLFGLTGLAQSPLATINGVVTDSMAATVPDAAVVATNIETGYRFAAKTNLSGFYSLRALPIGSYIVSVEHPGFRHYARQGISLTTGQSLQMDISLEVGDMIDGVDVSAPMSTLETRTSSIGQLVESRTIQDMPLGDRRTMNLINILGTVVFVNYDSGARPNFSLAGGRTQSQMFWIDGGIGQNMRLGIGQIDVDPPVEVMQEVRVLVNNYRAEYGASAGGVIIATTKSGTNRLHGSLFEYLRNDKFDAAGYFAPLAGGQTSKAPLRYNVFGGTLGGPVKKERTFFFLAYEGSRRRDGITRSLTVPTAPQRSGDFSQTVDDNGHLIPIYDPATTRIAAGRPVRDPFPGNRIPADQQDPAGRNVLPFFPSPNRAADDLSGANNFRGNYVQSFTRDNVTLKVDHLFNGKNKLSGRYIYNNDNRDYSSVFPDKAADSNGPADRHQQLWHAAWNRILTPSLINDLRISNTSRINHEKSFGLGQGYAARIGIGGVSNDGFPVFNAAGFTQLGNNTVERRQFPIEQHHIVDDLSWVRGRHSLKFGATLRPSLSRETNRSAPSGNFTFGTTPSGQPGVASSGSGLASLLLGFPTSFRARETQALDRYSWYLAWFAQDDWAAGPSLTVNFGVRWETDTPITDRGNRINGFDTKQVNPVSGTPGVVKFAGLNGWRRQPYDANWTNFGPRLGFAWKPFGPTTVIRGGYGIFYAHPFDHTATSSASLGFESSAAMDSPDNGLTAPFYLRNGVPGLKPLPPDLNDAFGAVPVGQPATTAVTFFESGRRTGYSQQFNLSVQRDLPGSIVLEVGYLGNLCRRLPSSNLSLNQIRPEILGPGRANQRFRPFPQFDNVSIVFPTLGVSSYNAAEVRVEKRFSNGLSFLSTYTWSKFLNNTDEGGASVGDKGSAYSDLYNRKADWGPSENDIRHRFTWGSVYDLPFGRSRHYLSRGTLGKAVSYWSVGSVVVLQAGAPFTVTTQTNTTNAFSAGLERADVLRNPNFPVARRKPDLWFDTAAFAQPAPFRFGNQGVNILRADGVVNFDFSALRNFPIMDRARIQFRAELLNAFNRPNFGLPGRVLGGAAFGIVSSAQPGRRVQFGLRATF